MFACVYSQYLLIHVSYAVPPPDAFSSSDIEVAGGSFTGCSSVNGGFLFASENAEVKITGGNIVNNLAVERGAGVSPTLLYKPLNSTVYSVQCQS